MDVSCPQCHTVYEVEDLNAYSASVSLQCSQCSFVFRLNAAGHSIQENQRRWMIRTHDSGDILYINTFDMLHRWIMEGVVSSEDVISRTGDRWVALKDIGEFAPIFQTVESIAKIVDTRSGGLSEMSGSLPVSSSKPSPKPVAFRPPEKVFPRTNPETQSRAPARTHTLPFGVAAASRQADPIETRTPTPVTVVQAPRAQPEPVRPHVVRPQAVQRSITADYPVVPQPKADDDWSFGGAVPELEYREEANNERTMTWAGYDIHAETRRTRRRNLVVGLALSVVIGGGVLAYFERESLELWWTFAFASSDVIKLGDSSSDNAPEIAKTTEQPAARVSVTSPTENALYSTSSKHVFSALALAEQQQKQHHQDAQAKASRAVKSKPVVEDTEKDGRDSNSLPAVLSSAKSALERGNTVRARQLYHRAVGLDPQNAEAISGLGWSLLALGNADSARAQFLRAKYRDPDFDGSYIGLGRAERELGNLENALKAYEDYISRFPNGPQVTIARYQSQELKRQLGD